LPLLFDRLTFIYGLTARRVLPTDGVQLDGADARISLNSMASNASEGLDRSMLTGVVGIKRSVEQDAMTMQMRV
jgi:hypothetical protein